MAIFNSYVSLPEGIQVQNRADSKSRMIHWNGTWIHPILWETLEQEPQKNGGFIEIINPRIIQNWPLNPSKCWAIFGRPLTFFFCGKVQGLGMLQFLDGEDVIFIC